MIITRITSKFFFLSFMKSPQSIVSQAIGPTSSLSQR